jgi:pimeloyl-ACP methyl ester carboxylesterase
VRKFAILLLLAALAAAGHAALREQVMAVPVTVQDAEGRAHSRNIMVTVYSDGANPQPAPLLVLQHGRAADAQGRAGIGRARYGEAARFFVQQGFVVAVPVRIGYGVTGGEDVEASGPCDRKRYAPAYAAAARQTLAVLDALRQRPDVAPDRAVVVGQSYGGMAAIAVAALNPPGVQAAINFAGGGGGNPKMRPQQPCSPEALQRLCGAYGVSTRIPTLWIYTENDLYFGPEYPRQWYAAFTQAGGQGEFVQFPALGEDGHALFTRFPGEWQPIVLQFLRTNGFATRPTAP